jgi:nucleoside 2-deoxyribosyltransferase
MVIYLSGKYSGEIIENIDVARRIAIELWEQGFSVLTPHLNTYHFETDCKCTYEQYIQGDLEMLSRCDVIVMLQGWNQSKGATKEREFAKYLGMPIYYYPEIPTKRDMMSSDQEAHLAQIINKFIRRVIAKYLAGQKEHGGNLFDKPNLPMLLEEVLDQVVYGFTLEEQIKRAVSLMFEDDEAMNILIAGNPQGKKLNDRN